MPAATADEAARPAGRSAGGGRAVGLGRGLGTGGTGSRQRRLAPAHRPQQFQGGFNTNAQFTGSNRVAGRHLGNARLTYKTAEGDWEVAAIGSNVFNKSYYVSNFDLLSSSGAQYGLLAPPREFAIQVQKKF